MLRLDHVILRSPEPEVTVAVLREAGLPLLEALTPLAGGGLRSAILRAAGIATSPPLAGRAQDRTWRAVHLRGLLPGPFPAPFTTRAPGRAERLGAGALDAAGRIGVVARAGARRLGSSMVVVTRYDFDVASWRAAMPAGPGATGVEVGIGNRAPAWAALGPLGGPALTLRADGPTGVRGITLAGAGWHAGREPLVLGDVTIAAAA